MSVKNHLAKIKTQDNLSVYKMLVQSQNFLALTSIDMDRRNVNITTLWKWRTNHNTRLLEKKSLAVKHFVGKKT